MEIAYHPDDRARQWAMFAARIQAYQTAMQHLLGGSDLLQGDMTATAFGHTFALDDALGEILEGDWSLAKACAFILIALTLAQHHIWGTPLPSMRDPMGRPSAFALALHVFETGESIVMEILPSPGKGIVEEDTYDGNIRAFDFPLIGGAANDPPSFWDRLKSKAYAISPTLGKALGWAGGVAGQALRSAVSFVGALSSMVSWVCSGIQKGIDFIGRVIAGERWTKMRETVNFQNPNVQTAIEVIGWGIALLEPTPFGELAMLGRAAWRASRLYRFGRVLWRAGVRVLYKAGLNVLRGFNAVTTFLRIPIKLCATMGSKARNVWRAATRLLLHPEDRAFLDLMEPYMGFGCRVLDYYNRGFKGDDLWRAVLRGSSKSRFAADWHYLYEWWWFGLRI